MKKPSLRNIKTSVQAGFTLVEVLVVIGILAILLAITLVAINPGQHFQDSRNSQRSANVTAILDAIYEYESQHTGSVPPALVGLAATKNLGTGATKIDLCADLVPAEIADLPMDPSATAPTGGPTPCDAATTAYDSGYTISPGASNRFTVAAPSAEGGATISVTR